MLLRKAFQKFFVIQLEIWMRFVKVYSLNLYLDLLHSIVGFNFLNNFNCLCMLKKNNIIGKLRKDQIIFIQLTIISNNSYWKILK